MRDEQSNIFVHHGKWNKMLVLTYKSISDIDSQLALTLEYHYNDRVHTPDVGLILAHVT